MTRVSSQRPFQLQPRLYVSSPFTSIGNAPYRVYCVLLLSKLSLPVNLAVEEVSWKTEMGLGVLESRENKHVAGSVVLLDDHGVEQIILRPTPSEFLSDPLVCLVNNG